MTAGTLLHKTRTDLRKWLLAIWLLRRKITHAMRRGEHELLLFGVVEFDESLVGGRAHLRVIDDASAKTLTNAAGALIQPGSTVKTDGWRAYRALTGAGYLHEPHAEATPQAAGAMIQPGSTVKTDGWSSYRALPGAGYLHEPHVQSTPQSVAELLPWVHIVISNFKRWQLDVFHGVSAAHLQSYLDELCYRPNRRDARLDLFRRILNRCVLYTPPTTYSQLIARAA